MAKRFFLIGFCICIALVVAPVKGEAATKTLKISYNVAQGSSWDKGAQFFKKYIEEKSEGRFKVETFPNAALAQSNDRVEIEMAQSGVIDLLIKSTMWLPSLDNKFQTVMLPFQFPNHDVAEKVMDGPAGDSLLELLPKHRLQGLAWGVNGFRQVTNSKKDIRSPADIKGLKVRVPGIELCLDIFKTMGATPVSMSFAEVFPSLQTKTVDGQENPLSLIWSSRFFEAQEYCTLWNYMYDAICFIASQKLWDSLSDSDRILFKEAAKAAMNHERMVVREEDKTLVGELEKKGMKVTQLTDEELKGFQDTLRPVYDEYKIKLSKDIVDVFEKEIAAASAN